MSIVNLILDITFIIGMGILGFIFGRISIASTILLNDIYTNEELMKRQIAYPLYFMAYSLYFMIISKIL